MQSIQLCLQLLSALNGYFLPKLNTAFAHQKFHQLQFGVGELNWIKKLEGQDCNFGADFDNQVRDLMSCTNFGQTM